MAFSRATFNRFDQRNRLMSVHVTKLLDEENGEIKTKPAQNSLTKLCENGLAPDLLMCRSKNPLIAV
jgi:CTP synthase (UTP-ammonia lyase)